MKQIVSVTSQRTWWTKAYAVVTLSAMTATPLPAQTLTTLYTFSCTQSACPDGASPYGALVQATNGDLYGTTEAGGAYDRGTVFRITPSGALTSLYSFCSQAGCTDGQNPYAGLIQAANGDFYGTTFSGGANGQGTVFKISPSGTLTTLYSFGSRAGDGAAPYAGLIQARNGDLYGTTTQGGAQARGTIFGLTPTGTFATLHDFCSQSGCADGYGAYAGLAQAASGDLYGTTTFGGSCEMWPSGCGTIFRVTPRGALTTLYTFCGPCADGWGPGYGPLVQAANGDFYGTTYGFPPVDPILTPIGTIFRVTPGGALTTLYSFCFACPDGAGPSGLVQATDGNLYGTTNTGGSGASCELYSSVGCGTIFKIAPSGTLTTLYDFCSQSDCADGASPFAGLTQATNGDFYGTTTGVFNSGGATVFRLSVGLRPFVKTLPTSGTAGASVRVLGTNLAAATSVNFNGAAAVFEVVSSTEIVATVPAGASSGEVQVVTPSGTLSSNVAFQVLP